MINAEFSDRGLAPHKFMPMLGVYKKRFIEGESCTQTTLLPESIDDYVSDTNPVRIVDAFVDELDLGKLGFEAVEPAFTGRPAYHPAGAWKKRRNAMSN